MSRLSLLLLLYWCCYVVVFVLLLLLLWFTSVVVYCIWCWPYSIPPSENSRQAVKDGRAVSNVSTHSSGGYMGIPQATSNLRWCLFTSWWLLMVIDDYWWLLMIIDDRDHNNLVDQRARVQSGAGRARGGRGRRSKTASRESLRWRRRNSLFIVVQIFSWDAHCYDD